MGLDGIAVDASGEAEAAAPGAVAELTEQGAGVAGGRFGLGIGAFGTDHQGAIGGFDIDAGFVDAGQLEGNRVGLGCFPHFGAGHALGGLQLLFEFAE